MPILAPMTDFAGVGRELAVTAFQSASGLFNLITPTSGVVMGALAISRISYVKWVKFMIPLIVILFIFSSTLLSIGAYIS